MAFLTPYELHEIFEVIQQKNTPVPKELLSNFSRSHNFTTKTIDLDEITENLRIGVFVAPDMFATPTTGDNYDTHVFHPAYWKDKTSVEFEKLQGRQVGANFQAVSLEGRIARELQKRQMKMENKKDRLMEWIASSLLLKGKYTAVSEKHPAITIDMNRPEATTAAELNSDKSQTADLTVLNDNGGVGLRAWDSTGGTSIVNPFDDIQHIIDICPEAIEKFYIGEKAWQAFKKAPGFRDTMDTTLSSITSHFVELLPTKESRQGLKLRAFMGTIPFYTYTAEYEDVNGVIGKYLPDTHIVAVPAAQHGVRCFGAIQHGLADLASIELFWNSWIEEENGNPWLQGQSALALIHTKINSTAAWKVVS